MKNIIFNIFLFVIVFYIPVFSQNNQDSLIINYSQNKIYAIICNSSGINAPNADYEEGLSDFIAHSKKLAENIEYPLEIYFVKIFKLII